MSAESFVNSLKWKRKKIEPEKPRRVIEPIEPITVDLSTRPWDAGTTSLYDQLREKDDQPFIGEGLLMRASTNQLRKVFSAIVQEQGQREDKPWTQEEQQLVIDVAGFVAKAHKKQKRYDQKTPYEHHLLRIAARVAQLDISNPYMVAVALLHDAPEDQDVTLRQMLKAFKKYDKDTITMLFNGANALNNQPDGIELTDDLYYENIETANGDYPDLHLWVIKGFDRYDSFNSDLSATIRHKEIDAKAEEKSMDDTLTRDADAAQLRKTTEKKILPIRKKLEEYESISGIVGKLNDSLELSDKLINNHKFENSQPIQETIVFEL